MIKSAALETDLTTVVNSSQIAVTQNHMWAQSDPDAVSSITAYDDYAETDHVPSPSQRRLIGIAQRMGLPPPLTSDFLALWCDNRDEDSSAISMGPVGREKDVGDVWADLRSEWWEDEHDGDVRRSREITVA